MKLYYLLLSLIFLLSIGIRYYQFTKVPLGLYIDDVSIGYNAASILNTGKDEYGVRLPFALKAFGEYKMPVYIYLTSLSIAAFGVNDFAVRFPSLLFSILTIVVFYLLLKELVEVDSTFLPKKNRNIFLLLGTFLFGISPWHVMLSRAGFEVTVGLFFYTLSCYLFLSF